jgi:hypothetical protein
MTDFERIERLLLETFDDELFYDVRDDAVSGGSCTIEGITYKWHLMLDDASHVRISYKKGTDQWTDTRRLADGNDLKLLTYLRKMATTVSIIRNVQKEPKDSIYFSPNDGWVNPRRRS